MTINTDASARNLRERINKFAPEGMLLSLLSDYQLEQLRKTKICLREGLFPQGEQFMLQAERSDLWGR